MVVILTTIFYTKDKTLFFQYQNKASIFCKYTHTEQI